MTDANIHSPQRWFCPVVYEMCVYVAGVHVYVPVCIQGRLRGAPDCIIANLEVCYVFEGEPQGDIHAGAWQRKQINFPYRQTPCATQN